MTTKKLSIVTCHIQLWGSLWILDQIRFKAYFDNVLRKIALWNPLKVFLCCSKLVGIWSFKFLYGLFL